MSATSNAGISRRSERQRDMTAEKMKPSAWRPLFHPFYLGFICEFLVKKACRFRRQSTRIELLRGDGPPSPRLRRTLFFWIPKEKWRRGPESNRRIEVLQTSALPLGYRALSRKAELAGKNEARKRRFILPQHFGGGARRPDALHLRPVCRIFGIILRSVVWSQVHWAQNGLCFFSWASVVRGPWPGAITVLRGRVKIFLRLLSYCSA